MLPKCSKGWKICFGSSLILLTILLSSCKLVATNNRVVVHPYDNKTFSETNPKVQIINIRSTKIDDVGEFLVIASHGMGGASRADEPRIAIEQRLYPTQGKSRFVVSGLKDLNARTNWEKNIVILGFEVVRGSEILESQDLSGFKDFNTNELSSSLYDFNMDETDLSKIACGKLLYKFDFEDAQPFKISACHIAAKRKTD